MKDKKNHTKPTPVDSKDALLQAGRCVFARKGFEGATVKDLADEAGVNISMVSYYFGGKEGLYRACMEGFALERIALTERILKTPQSREDFKLRLKLFAEEFIEIHLRDRDTCKMIHRGMDTLDEISADLFKNVFIRLFETLRRFVASAQKAGFVRRNLPDEAATAIMFGGLVHVIRADDIRKIIGSSSLAEPKFAKQVIDAWVEMTTEGLFAPATTAAATTAPIAAAPHGLNEKNKNES